MAVLGQWQAIFSSLGNTQYRWFWLSGTASAIVFQMNLLVRGWLVTDLGGGFTEVGAVSFAAGAPLFLMAPFGGAIADRWDKRNLIIVSQVIQCVAISFVAVLVVIDAIAFWHLLVSAVFNGVMFALNLPSRQAIVPSLVEKNQVMNAVALNTGSQNAMRIFGPGAGGLITGLLGVAEAYLIMVAFTIISIILMLFVKSGESRSYIAWTSVWNEILGDISDGVKYVRRSSVLMGLLILTVVPVLFGMPYIILLVAFARETLGLDAGQSGFLYSAAGLGAFSGSIIMAYLGDFKRKGVLLLYSAIAFGIFIIVLSRSSEFYLPFLILIGVGLSNSVYLIANNSLLLLHSQENMRGRVMGLYTMSIGLLPMAAWPIGIAMDFADARVVFTVCGAVIAVLTSFMLATRADLRRI